MAATSGKNRLEKRDMDLFDGSSLERECRSAMAILKTKVREAYGAEIENHWRNWNQRHDATVIWHLMEMMNFWYHSAHGEIP